MAWLSGRWRPPRPSCLVKYNSILLPTNAVEFYIGHLCLLCRLHDGSALSALLGKWVCRHSVASSSHPSLDSRINAWGSVSDLHVCVGFRGNKMIEKHCLTGCRRSNYISVTGVLWAQCAMQIFGVEGAVNTLLWGYASLTVSEQVPQFSGQAPVFAFLDSKALYCLATLPQYITYVTNDRLTDTTSYHKRDR